MNELIVADVNVRQDNQGRYCLNDLHKAAGGLKTHQLANWTRNDQTKELIAELKNQTSETSLAPVSVIKGGYGTSGTFVVKELVYAYAMWISPAFHLKVIRAYDTLQTQGIAVADHAAADMLANPLVYFERVLQQAKQLEEAKRIAEAERDVSVQTIAKVGRTLREVCRKLPNVNLISIPSRLKELGYLYRNGKSSYLVYSKQLNKR